MFIFQTNVRIAYTDPFESFRYLLFVRCDPDDQVKVTKNWTGSKVRIVPDIDTRMSLQYVNVRLSFFL